MDRRWRRKFVGHQREVDGNEGDLVELIEYESSTTGIAPGGGHGVTLTVQRGEFTA